MFRGSNRVDLPSSEEVPPGAQHTFQFTLTAPMTPGVYTSDWRMLQEAIEWFGAVEQSEITVTCPSSSSSSSSSVSSSSSSSGSAPGNLVQGPLDFTIVDELDSILIDEARTPLIISGAAHDDAPKYRAADAVARVVIEKNKAWDAAERAVDTAKRAIKAAEPCDVHALRRGLEAIGDAAPTRGRASSR